MLELITPVSYWILSILWLIILALYLGKLKQEKAAGGAVAILLTLLSIDAFRTLFESVYFGLYFNSMFGLLPQGIYDVLSTPGSIIIPKIVNIMAGVIVLTLLIRKWVPNEIQAREERIKILEDSNAKLNRSEARFRTLMENIPVPLVHMDMAGNNIFRNEHFIQLFGYTEEIVPTLDEWWLRAYPDPTYRTEVIQTWEQAVLRATTNNTEIETIEVFITCQSGEQRNIEVSGIILDNEVLVTFNDLTAQKQTQAGVEKARAEFEAIFNSIADAVIFVNPQRQILRVNPCFTQMFGYQLAELVGKTTQTIYADPDNYENQGQTRFNPEATIAQPVFENEYRRKDGTTFIGETLGAHVVDESGILLGYLGIIHDVTARKKAEEMLLHEKAFLRSLIDSADDVIYFKDNNGLYLGCNKAAEKFTGIAESEQIGKSDFDFFEREMAEHISRQDQKVLEGGKAVRNEEQVVILDSEPRIVETVKAPIFGTEGQPVGLVGISRDITKRKELEQGLLDSEQRFKKMFRNNSAVMLLIDPESGSIIDANLAAESFYGYSHEELISSNISQINTLTAEFISEEMEKASKQKRNYFIFPHRISNGEIRTVEVHSTPIQVGNKLLLFSIIHDVSAREKAEKERLELESQLRQKYKMEAVGVMAGGMAHNFNNNLAIILGNLELSKRKIPPHSEVLKYLDYAKIAVGRSRDLVKQILTYSRNEVQSQAPLQLSHLLQETISLLRSTIPSSVKLRQEVCPDCDNVYIKADASQIQECLINLCNNAVHAMNEQGDLLLRLERIDLEMADIPARNDCSPGTYLCLSVQDNGCGIPAEIQEKIFDPFFTTKELYEGTGMGLSTVQGIVEQHQGMITLKSNVGQQTIFNLYFPVVDQLEKDKSVIAAAELHRGSERILYIDDDEMIADLNDQMLTEMGYQVTIQTDSIKALNLFSENVNNFDLIITDQTMPELTGKELIEEIKKLRPEMLTILITGFSSKINEEEARQMGVSAFLMKPVDYQKLSQVIRDVLAGRQIDQSGDLV